MCVPKHATVRSIQIQLVQSAAPSKQAIAIYSRILYESNVSGGRKPNSKGTPVGPTLFFYDACVSSLRLRLGYEPQGRVVHCVVERKYRAHLVYLPYR